MLTKWLRALWYQILYYPTAFLGLLCFSMRVKGRSYVPPKGGLLVIANHQSFLDPPVVGLAVGRHLKYLARKTLFRFRPFAWWIDSLGAVPINQETSGTEGIKTALSLLKSGKAVLIFPEGSRTEDGTMQPLKPGVVVLIRRAGVPILPVGLAGPYDAWPIHGKVPHLGLLFAPANRNHIAVVVGKPIQSKQLADLPPDQILAKLQSILAELWQEAEKLRRK